MTIDIKHALKMTNEGGLGCANCVQLGNIACQVLMHSALVQQHQAAHCRRVGRDGSMCTGSHQTCNPSALVAQGASIA